MDDNLFGMSAADAKEYVAAHISTLRVTEKQAAVQRAEEAKWKSRVDLAVHAGKTDLAEAAKAQADAAASKAAALEAEAAELKTLIEKMKRQRPGVAARERSVDPDLLEQELLMATGHDPGEEKEAATERDFAALEKDAAAESALTALKQKLGK
jgi:phage shock protein A